MKMNCKYCDGIAAIVNRYKGHEYRHCRKCDTKYLTHEENNQVIVERDWKLHKNQHIEKR